MSNRDNKYQHITIPTEDFWTLKRVSKEIHKTMQEIVAESVKEYFERNNLIGR
jgi:hypothetical protein